MQHFGKASRAMCESPEWTRELLRPDSVAGAWFLHPGVADVVAVAALLQKFPWHAQRFRKIKRRYRGRRSNLARSSADFVAGAALWEGQVQMDR